MEREDPSGKDGQGESVDDSQGKRRADGELPAVCL